MLDYFVLPVCSALFLSLLLLLEFWLKNRSLKRALIEIRTRATKAEETRTQLAAEKAALEGELAFADSQYDRLAQESRVRKEALEQQLGEALRDRDAARESAEELGERLRLAESQLEFLQAESIAPRLPSPATSLNPDDRADTETPAVDGSIGGNEDWDLSDWVDGEPGEATT